MIYYRVCMHECFFIPTHSLHDKHLVGNMDITVAYFHPLFHSETVKRDFEQIRALGATSIVYPLHEQEEPRWPRDLERGFALAQEAGLKVQISLGRFGNLFAGPSLVPSWYTFRHPQSLVRDQHGREHGMTCFNHEDFRSWLFKEVEYLLSAYPVSGIVIEEPRMPDITCFCSVCRALCPDIADLEHFRRRSMLDFFNGLFASVKRVQRYARTTIVLLPQDLGLVEDLATVPHLDALGCHLFWQLLNMDVERVEQWGRTLVAGAHQAGKRSQLWLQNFNLDKHEEPLLEPAFNGILTAEPDEFACYYFWRNNANPEQVWQRTRGLLRKIPRRQLYWHSTQAHAAVPRTPVLQVHEERDARE